MKGLATWSVVLLAAAAADAAITSAAQTRHPLTSAVVKMPPTALSGSTDRALVQGGGPIIVRFVPQARFGVGIVLANQARQTITLERVRVVKPDLMPLFQNGTLIRKYGPPNCPPHVRGCGIYPPLVKPPYRAARAVPRPLAPGQKRIVQLNFTFGACTGHNAAATPIRKLLVTYRTRSGLRVHQALSLGDSTIELIGASKKTRCHTLP